MGRDSTARWLQAPARLAVVGADLALERRLADRIAASIAGPAGVVLTDDVTDCSILVAVDGSAFAQIALRAASARANVQVWCSDTAGELRAPADPATTAVVSAHASRPEHDALDALGTLLAALRTRVLAREGSAWLLVDGAPAYSLDFERSLVGAVAPGAAPPAPAELALALPRAQLADGDGQAAATVTVTPLVPLLWRAAIAMSDGGLLPTHRPGIALTLRTWPDFRALAHRHDHFRLSCLLLGKPMQAPAAAVLSGMCESEVRAFFGAAWMTGHAEFAAADAPAPAAAHVTASDAGHGAPRGSLFARLWRSVRGRPAGTP